MPPLPLPSRDVARAADTISSRSAGWRAVGDFTNNHLLKVLPIGNAPSGHDTQIWNVGGMADFGPLGSGLTAWLSREKTASDLNLFMLVSALMGRERMQAAYAHAINAGYRFYSYGDASLLLP